MSLRRLKACMSVQTASRKVDDMIEYIRGELDEMGVGYTVDDGNVYATKGTSKHYPCFVAHTDTVHKIVDDFKVYNYKGRMFAMNGETMAQTGIGGDDKVGVYIALEALRALPNAKAAFFRDEEIGCVGSRAAYMPFFADVGYVLQADRRGKSDFVNEISWNDLLSKEIIEELTPVIEKFGRKLTSGGPTDVGQLRSNGLKCCAANMSCGYYKPHTDGEYIVVKEVNDTLKFVLAIVDTLGETFWKAPKKKKSYNYNANTQEGWSGVYNPHYDGGAGRGVRNKSRYNSGGSVGNIWGSDDDDQSNEHVSAAVDKLSKKKDTAGTKNTEERTTRGTNTNGIDGKTAVDAVSLRGLAESKLIQCGNCMSYEVQVEIGDDIEDDALYCHTCNRYVHPLIL